MCSGSTTQGATGPARLPALTATVGGSGAVAHEVHDAPHEVHSAGEGGGDGVLRPAGATWRSKVSVTGSREPGTPGQTSRPGSHARALPCSATHLEACQQEQHQEGGLVLQRVLVCALQGLVAFQGTGQRESSPPLLETAAVLSFNNNSPLHPHCTPAAHLDAVVLLAVLVACRPEAVTVSSAQAHRT